MYGGKRNKLYFLFGNADDISSMESVGNYSVIFVDGKNMPLNFFLSLNLPSSSGTSANPYFPL